ncbi:uncharacterized protein LOC143561292 [Bidens hawaiensis]|uniref:uncharacterized protein LOC143561292 n=1 Tax=Bidens hawaiensis TaxID=980011 RepID=UPI00404A8CA3
MMFYLTILNLVRFLTESPPLLEEGADVQAVSALDSWKHSEYLCRNYVLNGRAEELNNVYCKIPSVKELWDTLEFQGLRILIGDMIYEGMTFSETFQVASMIEKLPPSWDNRVALKGTKVEVSARENMVEHGQSSRGYKGNKNHKSYGNGKGKFDLGPRKGGVKKTFSVFKGKCYNCGEFGHCVDQCNKPKKERENMIDEDEKLSAMITDLTAMMDEVNLASNHSKGW